MYYKRPSGPGSNCSGNESSPQTITAPSDSKGTFPSCSFRFKLFEYYRLHTHALKSLKSQMLPRSLLESMKTAALNCKEWGITCERAAREAGFHYTRCICTILACTDGNIVQCFNIIWLSHAKILISAAQDNAPMVWSSNWSMMFIEVRYSKSL